MRHPVTTIPRHTMRTTATLAFVLTLLAACVGKEGQETITPPAGGKAPAAASPVAAMDAAIAALQARPEHSAEKVTVQHILVSFQGAPRMTGVTRSLDEAKALAADLFARVGRGEDFTALMQQHSNDPGPGTYPMTRASRSGMVPGFGNVGWRLQVGEIGVAPHHASDSPYGWHIIKRVE